MKARWFGIVRASVAIGGVLLLHLGCSEPKGPPSVESDDLTLKVPAIKEDARCKSSKDVAQMVDDLEDDDSAVRFYAVQGLRRITGNDFGYHFYDDEDQRKPAVERWKKWLSEKR